MKTLLGLLSVGCLLAFITGCASGPRIDARSQTTTFTAATVTNDLNPGLLKPGNGFFMLGPGDQIEIEIIGTPLSRQTVTVGPDGRVYFNILPGLDVWGLTLSQTKSLLENELANYFTAVSVSMTLQAVASKHVWVLGRLNRPGIYPIAGPTTLLESIAMAGGTARSLSDVTTQELADLRHSFVVREGNFLPVDFHRLLHEGDMTQNIYLQADDFVYVPSSLSQEVYVFGSVRFPRALPFSDRMTLLSAIANTSGPQNYDWLALGDPGPFTKDAYLSHIAIVRGSLATPQIAVVDYNEIVKGRASDVRLEPGDIIYVPNSPYTQLKRYVNLILNSFVVTIAANEGTRAGGGAENVGVSVPVN
ncbi:MAG: polysaccharide biosynthesis/export family protein [Verrucomicrobia bacterium]|nr:polysaccharide biosynthesis/export family protein [Verrucomicrobiota bacterium]